MCVCAQDASYARCKLLDQSYLKCSIGNEHIFIDVSAYLNRGGSRILQRGVIIININIKLLKLGQLIMYNNLIINNGKDMYNIAR